MPQPPFMMTCMWNFFDYWLYLTEFNWESKITPVTLTDRVKYKELLGFHGGSMRKNLPAMQEMWVLSLDQEDPWKRVWQLTPVFLPGESHGQRSLIGYGPWGHEESDTTEQLSIACIHTYIQLANVPTWFYKALPTLKE